MDATVEGAGCRLVIRVRGFERPDEQSGSDANWLTGDVELREQVGAELSVGDCETDQSYLAQTVRELDALVAKFPVRGDPF